MKKFFQFLQGSLRIGVTALLLFSVAVSPVSALTITLPKPNLPDIGLQLINAEYDYEIYGAKAVITKYKGTGSKITVPAAIGTATVTEIDTLAFNNCQTITSIVIPNTVTNIGADVFRDCINLKSVTLPDGLTKLGLDAFASCSSLTTINLPASLTELKLGTFNSCTSLTEITIPAGITTIETDVFFNCTGLSTITLPKSVAMISGGAFSGCSNLASIYVAADNPSFASIDGILYSKDKSTIVRYPSGKTAPSFAIPDGVKMIAPYAFSRDKTLKNVIIPGSVTKIGMYAFLESGLTGVKVPDSVVELGKGAFFNNLNLTSAVIGNGVPELDQTFWGCTKLKNVSLGTGVKYIVQAFQGCSSLTGINIPNSVTQLGLSAFQGCTSLKGLALPYSVTVLKQQVFSGSGLEKIWFYGNAPDIHSLSFSNVSSNLKLYYLAAKTGWSTPLWKGIPAEPFEPQKILPINPVLPLNPLLVSDPQVPVPTLPFIPFDPTLPIPLIPTPAPTPDPSVIPLLPEPAAPLPQIPTPTPAPVPAPLPVPPPLPDGSTEIRLQLGQTSYSINGQTRTMDTGPIMIENRLFLPVRYIAEPLGATPAWEQGEQKATITMGGTVIELRISNNTAKVNGADKMIDPNNPNVKPVIVPPGRTMLPLRFIGESLGCEVSWDQTLQQAILKKAP